MDEQLFLRQFHHLITGPEGIAKLKKYIIGLAIRGELTSPSEPQQEANGISFPQSWDFSELGALGEIYNGNSISKAVKETKYTGLESGYSYIATKDLGFDGVIEYENGVLIPYEEDGFKTAKENAVLICAEGGSAGRKIGRVDREICFGNKLYAVNVSDDITSRYLVYVFSSTYFFNLFADAKTGIIGGISLNKFRNLQIPLPPEGERKLIVEKIDRLMALCDELEAKQQSRSTLRKNLNDSALHHLVAAPTPQEQAKHWQCLETNFRDLYNTAENVKSLRAAILQLAVQGKLVPQDPYDEPASQLLEKIKGLREKLIQSGQIKKTKGNSNLPDEDISYTLPRGWAKCQLADICGLITDGTHQTPKYTTQGRMFISAQNIKPFKFMPNNHRYVSEEDFQAYIKNRKTEKFDILMTRVGAGIGEAAVVDQNLEFAIYVSVALIKPFKDFVDPHFLIAWLNSPLGSAKALKYTYGKGVSQGNLNLSLIRQFSLGLPPLNEQKRIVKKVDQLMALCDRLEQQIGQSEKLSAALMDSILHHAFAQEEEAREAA